MAEFDGQVNRFVADELPALFLSDDLHDMQGAQVAARYLTDQYPATRAVASLRHSTYDVVWRTQMMDEYPRLMGRMCRFMRINPRLAGVVALAEFRLENSLSLSSQDVEADIDATRLGSSWLIRNGQRSYLEDWQRRLLSKSSLTELELHANQKITDEIIEDAGNPLYFINAFMAERKAKKITKRQTNQIIS